MKEEAIFYHLYCFYAVLKMIAYLSNVVRCGF